MALRRSQLEGSPNPNQLDYWSRYYRGQDLFGDEEDFAPGCMDYFYEYSAGWIDGANRASAEYTPPEQNDPVTPNYISITFEGELARWSFIVRRSSPAKIDVYFAGDDGTPLGYVVEDESLSRSGQDYATSRSGRKFVGGSGITKFCLAVDGGPPCCTSGGKVICP